MTKAVFRRRGNAFVPVDREGLALLASVKPERDVVIEVVERRNPAHHRLFFALCKFLVRHDRFPTIEHAKTALKIAAGEVDTFIDEDTGKTYFIPRSISWASMDQTKFAQFYDRAVWVITNRWMPAGMTEESVRAELDAMIEPSDGRDYAPQRILGEDEGAGVRTRERPLRNVYGSPASRRDRI